MDGSSSSSSSSSSSITTTNQISTSSKERINRARILGSVLGGTFGLSIIVLIIYFVTAKVYQRRNCKKSKTSGQNASLGSHGHSGHPANEHNLSRTPNAEQNKTHTLLDIIRTARPFPALPRKPPALPPKKPYTSRNVHHETPHLREYGAGGNMDHTNPFI